MTLNDYIEYIKNPHREELRARVVTIPAGESWTAFRLFYQKRGDIELRLSDFINEDGWLPMPSEIFGRLEDAIKKQDVSGSGIVLLGLSGYLALLTDDNKLSAIIALREWVDNISNREAICLLQSDNDVKGLLDNVFRNPRYRQSKQLIEIASEHGISSFDVNRTTVTIIGVDLEPFIPESCDTFQKYLRYTEEQPDDTLARRIVVTSKGKLLSGLSADVQQVMSLRDLARVFYEIDDSGISDNLLRWLCEQGRESNDESLLETLKMRFFPEGRIEKNILKVFDKQKDTKCEAILWLAKKIGSKGSYLESVVKQDGVCVDNFRSAYITAAAQWLDQSDRYANERREAILEANVRMSEPDIRQFIAKCVDESTNRVSPFLNCGTDIERAELLRRCKIDGIVSRVITEVYPATAMYLKPDSVSRDEIIKEYFKQYRELKIRNHVTSDFYEKAKHTTIPDSIQLRDTMVQQYAYNDQCALLVVDAMGAEWLPMLLEEAQQRNLNVESAAIGKANLPTSTRFNDIHWPTESRRLPDIKRFDNIVHNGVEAHERHPVEEHLAAALSVIGDTVLPRVADGLTQFEKVLVTADHGSSRLAVLAWQTEPKLAQTLPCEDDAEIMDWRYRKRGTEGAFPSEMEETLDGKYWVVRGYDRLPKRGGRYFELHGGATLEEQLVPVVVFSKSGQFKPMAKTAAKPAQIIENDDFDL